MEGEMKMSNRIAVIGESGSGKTTAMRTLDPATTFYIDVDGKGLSWKGWKNQYHGALGKDQPMPNYFKTRDIQMIRACVEKVATDPKYKNVRTIVIDTLNTAMVDKEVKGMREKGYDKWIDLASYVWDLIEAAGNLRDDLTIIFTFHSETVRDDLGYSFTHIKTNGRKLEKLVLESLFTTVLLARMNDAGENVLVSKAQNATCKAPMGALPDEMPNDMQAVLDALKDY